MNTTNTTSVTKRYLKTMTVFGSKHRNLSLILSKSPAWEFSREKKLLRQVISPDNKATMNTTVLPAFANWKTGSKGRKCRASEASASEMIPRPA